MKTFHSLTERQLLGLAISIEDEDARMYAELAEVSRLPFPSWSGLFEHIHREEEAHRDRLLASYRRKYWFRE